MYTPPRPFLLGCFLGTLLGAPMLLAALAGLALALQEPLSQALARQQAQRLEPPPFGQHIRADLDWQVQTLDGAPLDLQSLAGKPLFLHFWNPDCVPCLAELPSLGRLFEALSGADIEMVTVVTGDEIVRQVRALHVAFPVYVAEQRPAAFATGGTPASFLINGEGAVLFAHSGSARWDDPATVAYLRSLKSAPRMPLQ